MQFQEEEIIIPSLADSQATSESDWSARSVHSPSLASLYSASHYRGLEFLKEDSGSKTMSSARGGSLGRAADSLLFCMPGDFIRADVRGNEIGLYKWGASSTLYYGGCRRYFA